MEIFQQTKPPPHAHLDQLKGFAMGVPGQVPLTELGGLLKEVLPLLIQYIDGSREETLFEKMRLEVPRLRDCLRSWSEQLASVAPVSKTASFLKFQMHQVIHGGSFIEGVCWGLLPETAPQDRKADFGGEELFRHNVMCSLSTLPRTSDLPQLWEKFLVEQITSGANSEKPDGFSNCP